MLESLISFCGLVVELHMPTNVYAVYALGVVVHYL